ncbi:MAG TPA: ATP-binding protein, partial [Nitrospiria bacterium]
MARSSFEIPLEKLRASVKPKDLPFSSTEELIPLEGVIGQERAVRAMDFGLHIQDRGYNIFVCGLPGTGKSTVVKSMVKKAAAAQPTPGDWCYVHNFRDPDQPRALKLAAGRGKTLKKDMTLLIGGLKTELPKVFQSKEYQGQKQEMEEKFTHARDRLTDQLETRAREHGFRIKNTPVGMAVMPVVSGKTLDADDLEALDSEKKREIEKKEKELREHIHTFVQQIRMLREEIAKNTQRLERESIHFSSEHFFERLRENYSDFPWVLDYIHDVQADVLENFKDFLPEPESPLKLAGIEIGTPKKQMTRYAVNVVVDHSATRGVPVLEEQNPIYNNLIGRIEKRGHLGNLYTDFTLIKGGSILQANGGFLILNVLDILRTPFSWDALKRVIKNKELKIEDVGELYGFMASSGIKPQPIPVRIRVVLIGNP